MSNVDIQCRLVLSAPISRPAASLLVEVEMAQVLRKVAHMYMYNFTWKRSKRNKILPHIGSEFSFFHLFDKQIIYKIYSKGEMTLLLIKHSFNVFWGQWSMREKIEWKTAIFTSPSVFDCNLTWKIPQCGIQDFPVLLTFSVFTDF